MCLPNYNIQSSLTILTILKILCSAYTSHLPPNPWQPLIFFTVSVVLPFPECHIVGIIQYIAWLLSFSNTVCISDLPASFHGLKAHFFLSLNNIPLSGCTSLFIH